ncbi:AAA family ATPase [Chloroflexus aggregans]|uniref:ATPase AAA-type core domain-containing protein n=1 Tax=Chloroflexus aggregans (strain MD-66 / DSM 9485) TaxID=326427 RepID=B8GB65_CHLAD|nr:AAA family ATPase [Chloroflexus aggregans]ACL26665.1 conserved hypothetical protein [Chloroflexus aggregans DSM 9485]
MIERIVIHRFRGIRQGDLNHLRKFNLFIGPNNSGKTAILELLYLSATSGRPVQFIRDDLLPAETGVLRATTSARTDLLGYEPLPYLRQRHGKHGEWAGNPAVVTPEGGLEINLRRLPNSDGAPPWNSFRLAAPLPDWGEPDVYAFRKEDIARIAMFTLPQPTTLDPSMIPPAIAAAGIIPTGAATDTTTAAPTPTTDTATEAEELGSAATDTTTAAPTPTTDTATEAEELGSAATDTTTAAPTPTTDTATEAEELGSAATDTTTAAPTPTDTTPIYDWHYLWEPDWVYRWDRQQPIDRLAVWVTQGRRPQPQQVVFFSSQTANSHFTDHFAKWAYHHVKDWHETLAGLMAQVFPALEGAKIEVLDAPDDQPGRTGYVRFPNRTPLAIDQFGDGARHAFKLLAALTALAATVDDDHPGLLLWEEPEVYMHAATLNRLLRIVADIVAQKPIQVCITTQSLEVLAWLILYLDQQSAMQPDQISTFHLNLKDGRLHVRPFIGKALGGWFDFFGDPRLIEEDELASPLTRLLSIREERE